MRLLLTWSDRSTVDERSHRKRLPALFSSLASTTGLPFAAVDRGPVLRLLEQHESRGLYDSAWVLTTPEEERGAHELASEMRRHVASIEVRSVPVDDPSDHDKLLQALLPLVRAVPETAEVTVLLSAGTPQVQTLWVVLVKSGLLQARMVQVIPPAQVPRLHRAIREVTLDLGEFPELRALHEQAAQLRAREAARAGLIGQSPAMEAILRRLDRVATAQVPVLISGEPGTGKDLLARAVHHASARHDGPFLTENCGALAEATLEIELFGYEKGAFTGAVQQRRGLFELAHGGTLFLDEIAEAGPKVQVRLVRAIEQGVIRRVGGDSEVRVDVRLLAATHRDLAAMVRDGSFREDLYYRLKGAVLEVPPLRERILDLEPLVAHFLDQLGRRPMPTRTAWCALQAYRWPGNVRELRAEVARWVLVCDDRVELADLSPEIRAAADEAVGRGGSALTASDLTDPRPLAERVRELELRVIDETLSRNGGNLSGTARELAIDRNTLKRKLAARSPDGTVRRRTEREA